MAKTIGSASCEALIIGGSAGSLDVLLEIFPAEPPIINASQDAEPIVFAIFSPF